jgi:hypothetical protein
LSPEGLDTGIFDTCNILSLIENWIVWNLIQGPIKQLETTVVGSNVTGIKSSGSSMRAQNRVLPRHFS